MTRGTLALLGSAVLWVCVANTATFAQKPAMRPAPVTSRPAQARPQTPAPVPAHSQDFNPVVRRYCVGCHNDKGKSGGLSLAAFDVAKAAQNPEVAEKIIRKLQAGFMPPPLAARPDAATYAALVASLESEVDAAAAVKPNPGVRTFQRLNRPEYARAVRDLLALDVDAAS